MLRISEIHDPKGTVTLKLEGRLTGPWVDELRRVSREALVQTHPLTLDLGDLVFLDAQGVSLLRYLEAQSVRLANASPFVAEQFKEPDDV
jgi:anti-anti-sigma regulatory factor